MKYIISHDVGTQSNKAVLIGTDGRVYDICEQTYEILHPRPGWVEQRPIDYWAAICITSHKIVSKLKNKGDVLAMVFSTQSMGIIPVDPHGTILYNNISWVDARADKQASSIMNRVFGKYFFKLMSGVALSGKDVIPKLLWLKENEPDLYKNTHKFLDVNGFLKFKCTGKMVAEWSGACTYGFNLKKKDWERLFFKISGIDTNKLPDLVKSTDYIGHLTKSASEELGLPASVKIFGGCDDTQSAAMGSGQIDHHEAHIYLGTSAWIGVSSEKIYKHKAGVASIQSADPKTSLLVGITESAGANVEWALDEFYKKEKEEGLDIYELMEKEVNQIPSGAGHLIFTPWFQGERTPVTNTNIRSTIFNLSFEHNRGHILCALLEGIGYNLKWTIDNIKKKYGIKINNLTVIGGGSQNDTWMQSLSNILQVRIQTTRRPKMAGAIGCAMTALVGLGIEKDFSGIKEFNPCVKSFEPDSDKSELYQEMYQNYKAIYFGLKKVHKQINHQRFNQVQI